MMPSRIQIRITWSFLAIIFCSAPGAHAGKPLSQAAWGKKVAASARWYLETQPKIKRKDCSGLVIQILKRVGAKSGGGSRHMYQRAKKEGRLSKKPQVGDLVFFNNSYDANRNQKPDDTHTHVAVLIEIRKDQTLVMVHRGSKGIVELHMNLKNPKLSKKGKQVLNDVLRSSKTYPNHPKRLTAELFSGFARPPN